MFRFLTKLFAQNLRKNHRSAPARMGNRARLGVDELSQRILPSANPLALRSFADAGARTHSAPALSANAAVVGQQIRDAGGLGCDHGASLAATLTNATGATGQATFNN